MCTCGQAPPTLTVPASRVGGHRLSWELQPCRNYLKLEAQGAEIKSERFFPLPFLPFHPEGKCLLGGCFACVSLCGSAGPGRGRRGLLCPPSWICHGLDWGGA